MKRGTYLFSGLLWRLFAALIFGSLGAGVGAAETGLVDPRIIVSFAEVRENRGPLLAGFQNVQSRGLSADEARSLMRQLTATRLTNAFESKTVEIRSDKGIWLNATTALREPEGGPDLSNIKIVVGGVSHEFRTRNVGVELEFRLLENSGGRLTFRTLIRRTTFKGFAKYGSVEGALAGDPPSKVRVPAGFYQPIFETMEREQIDVLGDADVTLVRIDWTEETSGSTFLDRFPSFARAFFVHTTSGHTESRPSSGRHLEKALLVFISRP